MPQTLLELGGDEGAPPLHLAPANGFPPGTYLPMLRGLSGSFRMISAPPRALWRDETPPAEYHDWSMAAEDLLRALKQWDLQDIVAVGHSMGGVTSLLAALREPERFRALALLDPVLVLPEQLAWLAALIDRDEIEELPLVQAARRRRRLFSSRDEAFQRFRGKSHFVDWPDDALRCYIEHGLQARKDGRGFELVWTVEWEAYYYATIYQGIWQALPRLECLLPVLILRGEHSDTYTAEAQELAQAKIPSADFQVLKGQGHLFPQAAPEQTSAILCDWLRERVR